MNNFKLIIIDDKAAENSPLLLHAKKCYMPENVFVFNHSENAKGLPETGMRYILDNLASQMVVLLDVKLQSTIDGFTIFKKIREKTSLVYFILTVGENKKIEREEWIDLVNQEATYFIDYTEEYQAKLDLIEKAKNAMQMNLDCILAQRIEDMDEEDKVKPIVARRNGTGQLSWNDMLQEIRLQTGEGIAIHKNLISLTISRLTRGKLQL